MLAVTTCLFLMGCASTRHERYVARLPLDSNWPRIQQVAETEVKRREVLWPEKDSYNPTDHRKKIWVVTVIGSKRNGEMQRMLTLLIEDDGTVLKYKRDWDAAE